MKSIAAGLSLLFILVGCASQQPAAEIVEKGCLEDALRVELADCNEARLAAERRNREQEAAIGQLEQRLREQQENAQQFEKALADRSAELAAARSGFEALRTKAGADQEACNALRQELDKRSSASEQASARMKQLEDDLRQRLQEEIGARNVEIEQLRGQLSVRVLDRILFESGSAEILPRGRAVLGLLAVAVSGGDETIRIEGHTDNVPIGPHLKDKYFSNWELASGRASSVARLFQTEHAIAPTRMEAVGFSEYRPVAPNDTAENRQRNRRVEIVLTPWKPIVKECD